MALHFLIFPFLFLLISHPSLSAAEPVLDIDGDALQPNQLYYIVSLIPELGLGGGLTMLSQVSVCPRYVALSPADPGLPLRFQPLNHTLSTIAVSTPLNIAFVAPDYCRNRGVWRLGGLNPLTRHVGVGTDGKFGNEGDGFEILKAEIEWGLGEYAYKLSAGSFVDGQISSDLGVYADLVGQHWVGLPSGNRPLLVAFRKMYGTTTNNLQTRTTM